MHFSKSFKRGDVTKVIVHSTNCYKTVMLFQRSKQTVMRNKLRLQGRKGVSRATVVRITFKPFQLSFLG
jgi:hypothetical protein